MKNIPELSCAIVEDLLPLYIDGALREETAQAVREHLSACPACRNEYEKLAQTLTLPSAPDLQEEDRRGGGLSEKGAAQEPAESMAGGGLHHAGAGGSDSYKNLHHWRAGTSQ